MMKIDILHEYDNKLLDRKDLVLLVDHTNQPTPKKSELEEKIAEKFNVEKDRIEIIYIFSEKGKGASKVKVKIWNSPIKKVKENIKEGENEAQTSE